MDKKATIKELLTLSHLELAEILYRANDAFIDVSEENRLLKASEKAAIQSQKEQFEEMDKQIQELKKENVWLEANCQTHRHNVVKILNLEDEVSRLKGKVKEAWEAGRDFEYHAQFGHIPPTCPTFQEWSKDNQIE